MDGHNGGENREVRHMMEVTEGGQVGSEADVLGDRSSPLDPDDPSQSLPLVPV